MQSVFGINRTLGFLAVLPAQFDAKGDHNRAVALGEVADATAPVDAAD